VSKRIKALLCKKPTLRTGRFASPPHKCSKKPKNVFKGVVDGTIQDYTIKNTIKLEAVAASIGIETEGREIHEIAAELCHELERTYTQTEGEIPFAKRVPPKTLETWRRLDKTRFS
jgi:hydroxylamine reductase (hybrid-cluster protein)